MVSWCLFDLTLLKYSLVLIAFRHTVHGTVALTSKVVVSYCWHNDFGKSSSSSSSSQTMFFVVFFCSLPLSIFTSFLIYNLLLKT